MHRIPRDLFWGLAFLFVLVGVETAVILVLNHGHLVYVLDDPYIHVALAENIRHGHYGIDPSEFSAPSSSILWPFLLAPFAAPPFGAYAPFVFNLLSAAATVVVFRGLLIRLPATPDGTGTWRLGDRERGFALALMGLACNLSALIFLGLEHSLQVFLAATAALGLVIEARENRVPFWLPIALVLGPLVRYESTSVSLAAFAYLALRGRYRLAAATFAATALLMGSFSLFLIRMHLGPIPASVRVRLGAAEAGTLGALSANLRRTFTGDRGTWLLAAALLLLGCLLYLRNRPAKLLAGTAIAAILLHFAGGKYHGFSRYELYIWTYTLCILLYCLGGPLATLATRLRGEAGWKRWAFPALVTGVIGYRYIFMFVLVPLGSNNIYEQQFQMHRFATDYYRKPVAVNDLGYVAYDNPHYVLDLVGLASDEPQRFRAAMTGGTWMDSLARKKGVECAMIYENWFDTDIPVAWKRIGTLNLRGPRVSAAGSQVLFLAVNEQAVPEITSRLREFRETLPPGVTFRFEDEN